MTGLGKQLSSKGRSHASDDARRPVWLEATDSFYKKLNRVARLCELSRYQALSRGLDAFSERSKSENRP